MRELELPQLYLVYFGSLCACVRVYALGFHLFVCNCSDDVCTHT